MKPSYANEPVDFGKYVRTPQLSPNQLVEILETGYELIKEPDAWVQDKAASNSRHSDIRMTAENPEATCWCLTASVRCAYAKLDYNSVSTAYALLLLSRAVKKHVENTADRDWPHDVKMGSAVRFNDHPRTTHDDVCEAYRIAIDMAKHYRNGTAELAGMPALP